MRRTTSEHEEWVCRPIMAFRDPVLDIQCTPETGGKLGTIHQACGWETVSPIEAIIDAALTPGDTP